MHIDLPQISSSMGEGLRPVTLLLRKWHAGDRAALDELLPLVYDELRRIAAAHLRRERPGHTFRPTDLVSEAYLRMSSGTSQPWNDRVHFFAIAARSMRQILVEHARKRRTEKRGGGEQPVPLDDRVVAPSRSDDLLALDEALDALAQLDERKARAVELHYFGGMVHEEIAQLLEVHVNTVARDLRFAEAWIHRRLAAS
jgi:RNA polymerase sigma factor (TIGR02999 family)